MKRNSARVQCQCNECGHGWSRTISARTTEVRCPKCGGYDTELDTECNPGAGRAGALIAMRLGREMESRRIHYYSRRKF